MQQTAPTLDHFSPWPHRMAVLLVCATFTLIFVGGLVTTQGAGMAFRDWPTSDGHNLFLYPWLKAAGDKFIEHGHRLLGSIVGLVTIGLLVTLLVFDRRNWVRGLGVMALLLVIGQGVLGGMRVRADAVELAKLHGCVGPAFFALTVAIAGFTSRLWHTGATASNSKSAGKLHRLAIVTLGLAYLQLIIGAQLRHILPGQSASTFRIALMFHIFVANLLLVHATVMLVRIWRRHRSERSLKYPAAGLLALFVLQLGLGAATWVVKYSWPGGVFENSAWAAGWTNTAGSVSQSVIITSHVAVGSLILGTTVLIAIRALRLVRVARRAAWAPSGVLEAAG